MANQNKFTKSILERLEQEQHKPTQAVVSDKPTAIEKEIAPEIIKREEVPTAKESIDISKLLNPVAERVAKNKTFYLDEEVIEALQREAKAHKMTDSKFCNELLKSILGV